MVIQLFYPAPGNYFIGREKNGFMRLFSLVLVAALIGSLLSSCGNDSAGTRDAPSVDSPFFDLRSYFTGEIERLQQRQPHVTKTVRIDGKSETHMPDSLQYETELRVFLNADINRPAWWDKYAIDTVRAAGEVQSIQYRAKEKDLRVRQILIDFAGGAITRVHIERDADSPTAHLQQQLIYQPAIGYLLKTKQNVVFSQPKEVVVEVRWQ